MAIMSWCSGRRASGSASRRSAIYLGLWLAGSYRPALTRLREERDERIRREGPRFQAHAHADERTLRPQVAAHAGCYWSDSRGVERRSGSAFVTSSAVISTADWRDRTAATD